MTKTYHYLFQNIDNLSSRIVGGCKAGHTPWYTLLYIRNIKLTHYVR